LGCTARRGRLHVAAFAITPQTEIIETLAQWFGDGTMRGSFGSIDSEHSIVTPAGDAAATGVRVFTATSGQGLLYDLELLYTIAGWRVPLVLVIVSRALSSPITLEPVRQEAVLHTMQKAMDRCWVRVKA
jgi:pyruvate ferredoxin oxidoreductase alpha subunit